jgi:DNA-binding response OmpR family regulator
MNDERPVILLVEPDEPLGRVIASYLHHDGYRVVCRDRLDAMRELAGHRSPPAETAGHAPAMSDPAEAATTPNGPDLLLLDLDSLEPAERERQLAALPSVPLMLLTSERAPSGWGRHIERFSVLYKPFTIHELRRQVNDFLAAGGVQR